MRSPYSEQVVAAGIVRRKPLLEFEYAHAFLWALAFLLLYCTVFPFLWQLRGEFSYYQLASVLAHRPNIIPSRPELPAPQHFFTIGTRFEYFPRCQTLYRPHYFLGTVGRTDCTKIAGILSHALLLSQGIFHEVFYRLPHARQTGAPFLPSQFYSPLFPELHARSKTNRPVSASLPPHSTAPA